MFAIHQPKAPAMPMAYASAYTPFARPPTCRVVSRRDCAMPDDDGDGDEIICTTDGRTREIENLQADVQRDVNDIKKTHARWLPGRFSQVRRKMLATVCAGADATLPKSVVMAPLWPPVPRSKDLAKRSNRLDVHGHVIALKLWAKAVMFACRYDKSLPVPQKLALCRDTRHVLSEALHAHERVGGFDRWRLASARKHVAKMAARVERKAR